MTRTPKKKLWKIIIGLLTLIVLGYGVYYVSSVYKGLESLNKSVENSPFRENDADEVQAPEPPEWIGTEPVNILLMGVDARGESKSGAARSDSMLVVSLQPVENQMHVFSILRDTYTDIPGHGKNRINTAITHGPKTAMNAVSELLGIPIQYYVYTDFEGFIKLVDAIDGVDFYVEKDMHYTSKADRHEYDINLKQGEQHLDGRTALQYVRFRHDATSDYTRTERQRNFSQAVAKKLKSTTSIMKLPSILEEVSPYMDTNLTVQEMWRLATVAYRSEAGHSEQIPPMKLLEETYVGRAAVLSVTSKSELKQYVQEIFRSAASNSDDSNAQTDSNDTSLLKE